MAFLLLSDGETTLGVPVWIQPAPPHPLHPLCGQGWGGGMGGNGGVWSPHRRETSPAKVASASSLKSKRQPRPHGKMGDEVNYTHTHRNHTHTFSRNTHTNRKTLKHTNTHTQTIKQRNTHSRRSQSARWHGVRSQTCGGEGEPSVRETFDSNAVWRKKYTQQKVSAPAARGTEGKTFRFITKILWKAAVTEGREIIPNGGVCVDSSAYTRKAPSDPTPFRLSDRTNTSPNASFNYSHVF